MSQDASHRFIVEAREHLAAMSSSLISMERDPGNAHACLEALLRAAHSIKGGAGFVGRRQLERLAHAMEESLEDIRDGGMARSADVVDLLLGVVDQMSAMVDDLDHSDETDISGSLARLSAPGHGGSERVQAPGNTRPIVQAHADPAGGGEFPLSNRVIVSWPADSPYLYGVKLDWFQCEQAHGLAPTEVAARLERVGTVLESRAVPSDTSLEAEPPPRTLWCLAVVSSSLEPREFADRLQIPSATVLPLRERPKAGAVQGTPQVESKPRAPASSMRISIPLVDRMMALAGELVLVRNQAIRSAEAGDDTLRRLLRRLDSVTDELQDAALRMRTQPVGTLFERFPRMVRDLARQLGKQIEVEVAGGEVELDKSILEMLADPLTHLIRNCCDHGIESPDRRAEAGKPAVGRIRLSARQERGQMVIEIVDDGRGIDPQSVRQKALEQKVKNRDELDRMTDRQVCDLILLSGFSTAARVTDVSGRGVGMDVVKTNLDQIGGVVEIDSAPGRGTAFTLRLPLTLAIMPCLLLGCEGRCYAIPQRDIDQVELLGAGSTRRGVETDHEGEVLRWREHLLPVVRLREIFAHRTPLNVQDRVEIAERYRHDPAAAYAAVVRSGSRRFALVFDEVIGSENIVVKPLHPLVRRLGLYAATTVLGDGSVALILNGDAVARHGGAPDRSMAGSSPALPASAGTVQGQPMLLFRYGPAELLAMPMAAVRRVVMTSYDRIERVGDREVVNVDGVATSVIRIDRILNLSPCGALDRCYLILPSAPGVPVALLASEIVDTRTMAVDLDDRLFKADGVLGSVMIQGQLALLIDFNRIAGIWRQTQQPTRVALPPAGGSRVLVIDDTQFFQKVVTEYLQSQNHLVRIASNGSEGLAMLEAEQFDVVVCDIEMPVMDGLTFARHVRQNPRLAAVPLLALTTLNTPQSRAAALESGFDAFEVKLERGSFLDTVNRLLKKATQPAAGPGGATHG